MQQFLKVQSYSNLGNIIIRINITNYYEDYDDDDDFCDTFRYEI